MHRTLSEILRQLCNTFDKDWEDLLPSAVGRLRILNMKATGRRTAYEVLGLKPTMPATLMARLPVTSSGVDEYAKGLVEGKRTVRGAVKRVQSESAEPDLARAGGRTSGQIRRGDIVAIPAGTRYSDKPHKGERREDRARAPPGHAQRRAEHDPLDAQRRG